MELSRIQVNPCNVVPLPKPPPPRPASHHRAIVFLRRLLTFSLGRNTMFTLVSQHFSSIRASASRYYGLLDSSLYPIPVDEPAFLRSSVQPCLLSPHFFHQRKTTICSTICNRFNHVLLHSIQIHCYTGVFNVLNCAFFEKHSVLDAIVTLSERCINCLYIYVLIVLLIL